MNVLVAWEAVDTAAVVSIVVLMAVSALLVATNAAVSRVTPEHAAELASEGDTRAVWLVGAVERERSWVDPLLLMLLTVQLGEATLVGALGARLLGRWGIVLASVANLGAMFVLAVALPRTWALQHVEKTALGTSWVIRGLQAFPPVRWLARMLIGVANWIVPGRGLADGPFVSGESIRALARRAVTQDVIEESEEHLIHSVLDFGDTIAREVMVPRTDVTAVFGGSTASELADLALECGFSRFPVHEGTVDDITGVVHARSAFQMERTGRGGVLVRDIANPPFVVPEQKRVAELLVEMRSRRVHLAVLIDEYGVTAGVVTLEDLLEEIVGEIEDEFDNEVADVLPLDVGGYRVNARANAEDVAEEVGIEFPTGEWDTLGGLLLHEFGHVPVVGEMVTVAGHQFRVDAMGGHRITWVRLWPASSPESPGAEPTDGG